MTIERWRPIVGYEGLYEVSDLGRVRSLHRGGRILKPATVKTRGYEEGGGYLIVCLSKNAKNRNFYIHRLVLTAFVGPRPDGMESRHFPNPDRSNNRLDNLSWAPRSINQSDRVPHGTHIQGEQQGFAKLTENAVRAIRRVKDWPYGTATRLARQYGVRHSAIIKVRDWQSWKHVK